MSRTRNGAVDATLSLPGVSRPRGRPRTGKALTSAQRQALYRQRQRDKADQAAEFPLRVTENEAD